MKRPSGGIMLAGHPAVALPVWLGTGWLVYECLFGHGSWLLALLMAWVSQRLNLANDVRDAYLDWERAWNGMGTAPAATTRKQRRARPVLAALLLVALAFFLAAHADDPAYALALGWLMVAGTLLGMVALLRRLFTRRTRTVAAQPVSLCLRGIAMPVPSLRAAYRALPDHCTPLLR